VTSPLRTATEALEAMRRCPMEISRCVACQKQSAAALTELRRWEATDVGVSCEYGRYGTEQDEVYRRCYSRVGDNRKGLAPAVLLVRKKEDR